MKTHRSAHIWSSIAAALIFTSSISAADFAGSVLEFLFPTPELQTITVTNMTSAGRLRRQPSPGHPIYYAAISVGYHDFGGIKAGDQPIARGLVNKTMIKVLAKQGYLPVGPNQEPDIIIGWTWGTMYVEDFLGPRGLHTPIGLRRNLIFAGGEKLGLVTQGDEDFPELTQMPGLTLRRGSTAAFVDTVQDDLYVAVVSAYDVHLKPNQQPNLLWVTRISCPSKGFWLPNALPSMLVMAGPCIGHETNKPIWVHASDEFKPNVKIGDPRVVEYLETTRPVVVNLGPSR